MIWRQNISYSCVMLCFKLFIFIFRSYIHIVFDQSHPLFYPNTSFPIPSPLLFLNIMSSSSLPFNAHWVYLVIPVWVQMRIIYWSMRDYPVVILLKKMDSPFPMGHQLPIASQAEMELYVHLPTVLGICGLIFNRYCVCSYSCCGFMCVTSFSCLENNFSTEISLLTTESFHPFFPKDP